MGITPEQIINRLRIELEKYGLNYEDNSDVNIPRKSITRVAKSGTFGLFQDSEEVARVTSVSEKRLEIMVFDRKERENIDSAAKEISERLEIDYRVLKGY